jgi:coenzyme F420-reducing hydrogenase alpha subunit
MTTERIVNVDYVARVEGEGAVSVKIRDGVLEDLQLKIFEPPRFFEALLRGRSYEEAPDITSRICGICPVAYQMSACHAMEKAIGIKMDSSLRDLRRLLYAGEWIESHVLHIYLLHAPDFMGYPDALTLAKEHPSVVKRGLELKKAGNALMSALGGRSIHPVNVRVGGFYRVPAREELIRLRPMLERALDLAVETVRFAAGLEFPSVEENYEFVALTHPTEYPMNEGLVTSTAGLSIPAEDFEEHFEEVQAPYSNAYQVVRKGRGSYLTGPLARYALNHDRLTPKAGELAREIGLKPIEKNPNRSIVIRAIEVVLACEEGLAILDRYRPPELPWIPPVYPLVPGSYAAITEAPRGMLYHRYRISAGGIIEDAKIVAPTTQNQRRIEDDLKHIVSRSLDLDDRHLADVCERAIRNHDPCISCATHFLDFTVERF